MGKIKEFVADHLTDIIIIGACLFFIIGCWWLYTENRTSNEYNHVNDTVQQAETDNRSARQQIGNASAKINSAQNKLNDSIKRTGEITNRVNNAQKRIDINSKIIGECEGIVSAGRGDVEEARSIFDSVDKANQGNGTQTNRNT